MLSARFIGPGIAAALALAAGSSQAATTLQLDLNSVVISVGNGSFPVNGVTDGLVTPTGRLDITKDFDSVLAAIIIDGTSVAPLVQLNTLTGFVELNAGVPTSGQFNLTMNDGSTFGCLVTPNQGFTTFLTGEGYTISGLVFNGLLGQPSLGGVPLNDFFNKALSGTFKKFAFLPVAGADNDGNIDIFLSAAIPLPQSAGLALLGLATLSLSPASRRRR